MNATTKPSTKMRLSDLLDIAKALGLSGIYGTSKFALVLKIEAAQRGAA